VRLHWVRARPLLAGLGMVLLLLWLGVRQRTRTGIRSTRATIGVARAAIDAYRADHESRCPPSLAELKSRNYLRTEPVDAWGRALQLTCPGRRDPEGYDLVSFGPSGDLKGLDRVE
jgi:general secretion pathway protein G